MEVTKIKDIFLCPVRKELARLISLEDREPFSKTHGCFDRTYWGWKFTDFPGPRYQEAVYALAYIFKKSIEGNSFVNSEKILKWASAGLNYWKNLQHANGSFDEAYPMEQSLAATAFTSFYLGEAFFMLSEDLTNSEKNILRSTFSKAGSWLCCNDERHGVLSNHLSAAAVALYVIFHITGETRFEQRAQYFLNRIYESQSKEGWYEEYGGVDIGYQTHTTFYLSRLWQYTQDDDLLESLKRSISFFKFFVHPNGTVGGDYCSRNTEFYMPAGFEILAPVCHDAAQISKFMRQSIKKQTGVGLETMDFQNFMPLLNNYLFAAEYSKILGNVEESLPFQQEGEWDFPDAGLVVKSNSYYYAILAPSKGGVIKIYDCKKRKLHLSDCGYWIKLKKGDIASNQVLRRLRKIQRNGKEVSVSSFFKEINQQTLSPFRFILFRLFSITFGRVKPVAYWLKNLLVKTLVINSRSLPIQLLRKVNFLEKEIEISDEIKLTGNIDIDLIQPEARFTSIHMGSSRYFCAQEMNSKSLKEEGLLKDLLKNRIVRIDRNYKFK